MSRIGVFLCTCDDKIGKSIDVDAVASAVQKTSSFSEKLGVWAVPHACLPDGTRNLREAIFDNDLDRVVVAACPTRFQEKHLREVCLSANVNANHFALVDWREGCAWAHRGDKTSATEKAIDLVAMGIARVAHARDVDGVMAQIAPRALVIGGGIAGMTAARTLADKGISVTLVEQNAELGGALRGAPLNGSQGAYAETLDTVRYHGFVRLRLNARVVGVSGSMGDYRVEIENASGTREVVDAGAIVVATGAQELHDARLYRYDGRRVVTLSEFERQNSAIRNPQSAIAYILCAGSRNERVPYCSNVCCLAALNQAIRVKRAHPESRITILFRDLYLLGDEMNDEVVREARRADVEFARYAASNPPRVEEDAVVVRDELSGTTRRIAYNRVVLATPLVPRDDAGVIARLLHLTRDEDGFFTDPHLRVRPENRSERGIFVCGAAHRPVDVDTAILQGMTAAARAARWIESREVMRPAFSARVNEQFCTGCAQCVEACAVGAIEMGAVRSEPRSDSGVALRGANGTPLCSFVSLRTPDYKQSPFNHAHINPFLCLACGNCIAACPSKSIEMPCYSDAQIFAQIDAALNDSRQQTADGGQQSVVGGHLVFACHWSGFAAMELAGARRMQYRADTRVIELPCSARLDALHVLYALLNGAARVVVALCPPNECHFGNGNRYAEARIENLRAQIAAHGIEPRRLQIARMLGDDAGAWVRAMEEAQ